MWRYRHFCLPSLLFKIMNSDITCSCLHCSASLVRDEVPSRSPNETIRIVFLKGQRTWVKLASPSVCFWTGRLNNDLLGQFLPRASSWSVCITGTLSWNSLAWTLSRFLASIPVSSFFPVKILPLPWLSLNIQCRKSYHRAFYMSFIWISLSLL